MSCTTCGRGTQGCSTFAMSPLIIGNHDTLDVLVVGESPAAEDDTIGLPMQTQPFTEMIRNVLASTPWRVGYTHLVRCWAEKKPNAAQLELCYTQFFPGLLEQFQPRVIWAIGAPAARKILNSSLSLDKIRSMGVGYTAGGIPVVVLESPTQHSKYKPVSEGGKDLRPELKRRLELTHKILEGKYKPEAFEFTVVHTFSEALEAAKFLQHDCHPLLGLDTEVGLQSGANFAEQSERVSFLTTGFSALEKSSDKYRTFSIDHEHWERQEVYKMLYHSIKNKVPLATQCFFDFNLLWWQAGYDLFKSCPVYHDIHLLGWAQNQTAVKNGLEDQCVDYLGWAAYKAEMDELKAKAEKEYRFDDEGGLITGADYRHIKWMFPNEFMHYQAKDALGTARLGYERYMDPEHNWTQPLEKFNPNGYRLSLAYVKALSYMSRHGCPINTETLKEFHAGNREVINHYQSWLNAHPIVTRLFPDLGLNVKSGPQMHKVCMAMKITTKHTTEKTHQSKVDQDELLRQSNCHFEKGVLVRGAAQSAMDKIYQDFWYAVLQTRLNLDKNSKSQGLLDYALPGRGWVNHDGDPLHSLHPFFKVGKLDGGFDSKGGGGINTGRISSVWPSMGNVSKDPVLRQAFQAPTGYLLCEWDLSAIEPRVFAYLADEPKWKRIFELQADPATAHLPEADIYRVGWCDYLALQGIAYHPGEVTDDERDLSKVLILRCCYDSSPQGITDSDGIPLEVTTAFVDGFWKNYPALQRWAYATRKRIIEKRGWLRSASGRLGNYGLYNTYRLDDDNHYNLPLYRLQLELRMSGADAEKIRAGMNSEIQGDAGDINSTAGVDLVDEIAERKIRWMAPFNWVHDSIWAVVDERRVEEADEMVTRIQTDSDRIQDKWGIKVPFPRTGNRILRNSFKAGTTLGNMRKMR